MDDVAVFKFQLTDCGVVGRGVVERAIHVFEAVGKGLAHIHGCVCSSSDITNHCLKETLGGDTVVGTDCCGELAIDVKDQCRRLRDVARTVRDVLGDEVDALFEV